MRKYTLLALVILGLAPAVSCSGGKKLGSEEVIQQVVAAMCKKMAQCQPDAMPGEDFCKNTMKAALENNKNLPKLETSDKQLASCIAGIEKADCPSLLGDKPPEGCEFLK